MNEPLTIDPEFQSLIPPLSEDEFSQLEENCKRDGILDSLKVWNGILIDGHNRYSISRKWDLNYQVEEMDFSDREAVIHWIILNQFGRRNLSAYDRSVLALKLKPLIAEKAEKRMKAGKADPVQKSAQGKTREELAKVAGVSHDTIHKVETIETKAPEQLKEQVKTGQKTINQAYLELRKQDQKKIAIGAKERLEEAQERHSEFQGSKTVSIEEIQQDKKDSAEIAEAKAREIENALKKITFIGTALSAGDMVLAGLKKNLSETSYLQLKYDVENAIYALNKIRGWLA